VLVTFNESNCLAFTNTYQPTNFFVTNRVISMLYSNLSPTNVLQGHFILTSLHEFGTNVLIFGTGEYRASDVYLSMTPTANFLGGEGTVYFTGLTNGQPTWSPYESNSVPIIQDNPTNGPPWPNDSPAIERVSVIFSKGLDLWLMIYNGGNSGGSKHTGVYFSYAQQPWGPWSQPQQIFNKYRDGAMGTFMHDSNTGLGPFGPVIEDDGSATNVDGDALSPLLIELFTRITNSTLFIYYTLDTWNPYTVVKMRSEFIITPVIDPASLVHKKNKFSFSWAAPTNESYQVDYSTNLSSGWMTFTDIVTSTTGTFNFTNMQSGGLPEQGFYRLRTSQ
jgi:hypothetical protein